MAWVGRYRAPAKVNLTLEILGRRPDGYHEIRSVFQAIDLCDTLEISPAEDIGVECDVPGLSGEANLVHLAARLLREAAGTAAGARIRIAKRIPLAAGLGGGSSDAAAALVGLSRLWGLSPSADDLLALAARLGSDVSFFLLGGTAVAEGRGERLRPLPPLPELWAIVARPELRLADKTRRLYASLEPRDYADGTATTEIIRWLEAEVPHPLTPSPLRWRGGTASTDLSRPPTSIAHTPPPGPCPPTSDPRLLVNSFERVARAGFPEVEQVWQHLLAAGAPWCHLAGSGPCVYTLLASGEEADVVAGRLIARGVEAHVARTLPAGHQVD